MPKVICCRFMTGVRVSCNSEMCMRASRPSKRLAWCRVSVLRCSQLGSCIAWDGAHFGMKDSLCLGCRVTPQHTSLVGSGTTALSLKAGFVACMRQRQLHPSVLSHHRLLPTVPKPRSPLLRSPGLFPRQCKFAPSQPSWAKCLKG